MIDSKVTQKNYKSACKYYEAAEANIKELSKIVERAVPTFSFETAMEQFDWLLQGILLRAAAEDGQFSEEEKLLIKKITDYGDVMKYLESKGIDLTWERFFEMSNNKQKEISKQIILKVMDVISKRFIPPFALVDKALPKDYCKELTQQISAICIMLAQCDGDIVDVSDGNRKFSGDSKAEVYKSITIVIKLFKETWEKSIE